MYPHYFQCLTGDTALKNAYTNSIVDLLTKSKITRTIVHMWGGGTPMAMGDGVKFRVTKSSFVDYVYIKYLGGFNSFEIEYGALVGTDYDVLERVKPVAQEDLIATISAKVLFGHSRPFGYKEPKTA